MPALQLSGPPIPSLSSHRHVCWLILAWSLVWRRSDSSLPNPPANFGTDASSSPAQLTTARFNDKPRTFRRPILIRLLLSPSLSFSTQPYPDFAFSLRRPAVPRVVSISFLSQCAVQTVHFPCLHPVPLTSLRLSSPVGPAQQTFGDQEHGDRPIIARIRQVPSQ